MRMLNRFALALLALLLMCSSAYAEGKCGVGYYGNDNDDDNGYSADADYAPGLTADEADAYGGGATAVAGDYAMRGEEMAGNSQAQWAFRAAMNKLWEEHIAYTRNFIIAAAASSPSADDVVARLMQNQVDIGNAIKPYYGTAAGNQLTALLKEHISTAGEVVTAAKAGDTAKMQDANKRWFANADQIAAFLSSANPQAWPQAAVTQMMHDHLNLTTQEAKAELGGDWAGSIAAYDQVHKQILTMSGALADGIIAQFPDKF